jgi:hypothetical protein
MPSAGSRSSRAERTKSGKKDPGSKGRSREPGCRMTPDFWSLNPTETSCKNRAAVTSNVGPGRFRTSHDGPSWGFRSKASRCVTKSWEAIAFDMIHGSTAVPAWAAQDFRVCAIPEPQLLAKVVRVTKHAELPGALEISVGAERGSGDSPRTAGAARRNARSGQEPASPGRSTAATLHNGSYATFNCREAVRPAVTAPGLEALERSRAGKSFWCRTRDCEARHSCPVKA